MRSELMPRPDWTILLDDMATQRVRTCTLCGSPLDQLSLESWSNGTVVAAVVLCPLCRQRDAQRPAVRAVLERRYGRATDTEGDSGSCMASA